MEKFKNWIIAHKLVSIIIASVLVVGITLAIVLPLTLVHKHAFSESWSFDEDHHWHVCVSEECEETKDYAEHTFVAKNDETNHWQECNVCGYKKDEASHTFIAKNDATHYWQECSICGYQQEKIDAKVTDAQLANAILFKDAEGNYYTNLEAEAIGYNTAERDIVEKIKFTGDKFYTYNCGLYDTDPLEVIYANFDNDGVKTWAKYTKENESAEWANTSGEGSYGVVTLLNSAKTNIFMYGVPSTFEYDETNNTYRGIESKTTSDDVCTLKFANGKLVSVVVERVSKSSGNATVHYAWTISYGNAAITLPTIAE